RPGRRLAAEAPSGGAAGDAASGILASESGGAPPAAERKLTVRRGGQLASENPEPRQDPRGF
ncbi:MAG: hypothetical protein ACRDF9_02400, partial [Candidatus Limnocylindria bacterium]